MLTRRAILASALLVVVGQFVAGVTVDGNLQHADRSSPFVVASADTNNFAGVTTTVLYNLDARTETPLTQIPPNAGPVNLGGGLGIGFDGRSASTSSGPLHTPCRTPAPRTAASTGSTRRPGRPTSSVTSGTRAATRCAARWRSSPPPAPRRAWASRACSDCGAGAR